MSSLGIALLAVIGLGFIVSVFSFIIFHLLKVLRRNLSENLLSLFITLIYFVVGYDVLLQRGRSFSRGLGSDSWMPVAFTVLFILAVFFYINLLFIRISRIYTKKIKGEE